MEHKEWLKKATGDSQRGVARRIGIDHTQINREVAKGLDADRVIQISYAYGLNPVVELQQTGHLRPETNDDTVDGATHFQLIATVETSVDSMEILWPSDISFTDEGGMKINHTDLSQDTYPCETDQPEEFNDMQAGDKRRASVTLVAPENPQTMTYSPSTLPDARPVTWDMAGEL